MKQLKQTDRLISVRMVPYIKISPSPTKTNLAQREWGEQVPNSMAIGNVELMHEYFHKHFLQQRNNKNEIR